MNNKNSRNLTVVFRGYLVNGFYLIAALLFPGVIFGFIGILLLASNAVDPLVHFCRKGESRSIVLLDSRAKHSADAQKFGRSVELVASEYVSASARITTKSVPHPRVGRISKPAIEFNVTIAPEAPADATYEVTAHFKDPEVSKTIWLAVTDRVASDRLLESIDSWHTVWLFIKYGYCALPGICLLMFLIIKLDEWRWERGRAGR